MTALAALDGRVALVTGAARGLGRAIAQRFADERARQVFALDVDEAEFACPEIASVRLDVSDAVAVEGFVSDAWASGFLVDVLVCNAAVMQRRCDAVELSDEEIDRVMSINFRGVANCCRSVGRRMRARGAGRIITIGSQVSVAPWRGMAAYAASKGAVAAYSRALAVELAGCGVYVNCILPGTMDTNQMRETFRARSEMTGISEEELVAEKASSMPLGRMGTPEDAANLALFLASTQASFSIGAQFDLTGGELWARD